MQTINIAGKWKVILDEIKQFDSLPEQLVNTASDIELPDSVNHACIGKKNAEIQTGYLTDEYEFAGDAWYFREVEIKEDIDDKEVELFIEKSRITTVFFDGEKMDTLDSLCTPHRHVLPSNIKKGIHTIAVLVNNVDYKTKGGHMTSPDTQTNWNGLLGKLEIRVREKINVKKLKISTLSISEKGAVISVEAMTAPNEKAVIEVLRKGSFRTVAKTEIAADDNGKLYEEFEIEGEDIFWDEYHNVMFVASVVLTNGEKVSSNFGIRLFKAESLKLSVNNHDIFLRGKHDGMVFPLTGYAPMDENSWRRVLYTAKEYGINHYRFHTCCPPEAAFAAADEVGIYMEPELPFWGTVHGLEDPEINLPEQEYLIEEGFKILDTYGNHPSFFMLSMGNELWGSHERIGQMLKDYKAYDNRILYSGGSNNFQWVPVKQDGEDVLSGVRFSVERQYRGSYAMCDAPLGFVQTMVPNSKVDFDDAILPEISESAEKGEGGYIEIQYGTGVKKVMAGESEEILKPETPVISHEVGQYYFYPDFKGEEKYTAHMKPTYLKAYRENLEKAEIFDKHREYFEATGKLAVACYKSEIEALMKSSHLSGFQLLDLQDFPGQDIALVGILDAFMDSKKLITKSAWRAFCNDYTVMARIEKFVYGVEESITIQPVINIARWDEADNVEMTTLVIDDGGHVFKEKQQICREFNSRITDFPEIEFSLEFVKEPTRLSVKLLADIEVSGQVVTVKNDYDIWVYPKIEADYADGYISFEDKKVKIVSDFEEAGREKNQGEKVIIIPDKKEDDIPGTYCTDFWNYSMFSKISQWMKKPEPVGTLGLLIDEKHQFFNRFMTEKYSTPSWFNLQMNSYCYDLTGDKTAVKIVEPIDNPVRAKSLGLMFEKEGYLVLTVDFTTIKDRPEVKAFMADIVQYVYSR